MHGISSVTFEKGSFLSNPYPRGLAKEKKKKKTQVLMHCSIPFLHAQLRYKCPKQVEIFYAERVNNEPVVRRLWDSRTPINKAKNSSS